MAAQQPTAIEIIRRALALLVLVVYFTTWLILLKTSSDQKFLGPVDSSDEAHWTPRKVLLFSYGRSGSSFTADLIYHSPHVYYVFEPLRAISAGYDSDVATNMNELLDALLSCRLSSPLVDTIPPNFLLRTADKVRFYKCFRFKRGHPARQRCFTIYESTCRSFRMHMVKVIRYKMELAEKLMALNRDLAVIFLVRDPRASIWSKMQVFGFPNITDLESFAPNFCKNMETDIAKAQDILQRFPGRLRFLRYEDLADNPVPVSRQIYSFLQLEWTDAVHQQILSQTTNHSPATTPASQRVRSKSKIPRLVLQPGYTLNSSQSSATASKWRREVPWHIVKTIQTSCSDVMSLLGYVKFPTEANLRNMTLMARVGFELKLLTTDTWDLGLS